MRRLLALVPLFLCLAGCLSGPNYKRPQVALPPQFKQAPAAGEAQSIADLKWFDLFADDTLKGLVNDALEHNFDLRIAAEHVIEARAQYGITHANLLPTVDLPASFTTEHTSAKGAFPFPAGTPLAASYTQAGLSLNWEIDLWGRLRRLNEAARAQYLGTEEGRRGVVISLISDVMANYFQLRELDLELDISQRTRDIATDNLRLINLRHDRGAANGLDVRQAEQFLYTATAQIASVQRSIGESEDALSLLLGAAPGEVPRGKKLEELTLPQQLAPGLPSALLERRPDIRESEENLIAANAQIGAARALFFPQISLTGFFGGESTALTNLLTTPAQVSSIAPGLLMPIFHAGLRAGVRLTEAQEREALLDYQKAIYTALREVADSIVDLNRTRDQRAEEEKLVEALTDSVRLSNLRYRGGLDSYLQVLDAERNLFGGQLTLAELRLQEFQSVVQLYRALGGGWQ